MIKEGFYWIKLDADGEWTVAELENDRWYVIGAEDGWSREEIAEIGPAIEKPN